MRGGSWSIGKSDGQVSEVAVDEDEKPQDCIPALKLPKSDAKV
jgi:hypothetical protein